MINRFSIPGFQLCPPTQYMMRPVEKNDTLIIGNALATREAHVFLCALSSLDIAMQSEFLPNKEVRLDLSPAPDSLVAA